MKVEYLRTAKHSYMVVKEADFIFENYEIQMILHNRIASLLQMQIIVEDGKAEYWYDVTGMQSLEKTFEMETLDLRWLRFLFTGICDMKKQLENYLLDDRNIDLSVSMIFYDKVADKIRFCYIPGFCQKENSGMRGFLETVLQHLDHTDNQAVRLGYDMYEQCARSDFVVEDWRRYLNTYKNVEKTAYVGEKMADISGLSEDRTTEEIMDMPSVQPEPKRPFARKKKRGKKKQETDYKQIWEAKQSCDYVAENSKTSNPTVYFGEEQTKKIWELAYQGDGLEENIRIEKFPFFIGKDDGRADGILCADTVSRIHARFIEEEHQLYLEDYNSTNGTYLNGKLIPMNTPVPLQRGDRIIFATEEYILVDRRISK